tara:strand:- start:4303 stop:4491 length:189 start_codon:yes stop_codon:yes gene_type:complete
MTKQSEDTMYEIYTKLEETKLRPQFDKQLKKMETQHKHKWKDMCEKWEYAFKKISSAESLKK